MEAAVRTNYAKPVHFTMQLEEGYTERDILRTMRMIRGVASIRKTPVRKSLPNMITPELSQKIAKAHRDSARGETLSFATVACAQQWMDSL